MEADIRVASGGPDETYGTEQMVADVVAAIRDHGYCAIETPLFGQAFADVHRAAREVEERLAQPVRVVRIDQRENAEVAVTALVVPSCAHPDEGSLCAPCAGLPADVIDIASSLAEQRGSCQSFRPPT